MASDGDADEEFEKFHRAHFPRLVAFLHWKDYHHEAEDAALEAMTCLLQQWHTVQQPWPWVVTVAKRAAQRMFRARAREGPGPSPGHDETVPDPDPPPLVSLVEEEDLADKIAWIKSQMKGLPKRQREVLELWLKGTTDLEIAAALGIECATVRAHRARAVAALHERWCEQQNNDDGAGDA